MSKDELEAIAVIANNGGASLTIGLLGVEVPTWIQNKLDAAGSGYLRDLRLNEIERRILAIEATLATPTNGG